MSVDVTSRFRKLAPARPTAISKELSVFSLKAVDLLGNILELENLLHRIRPQYLLPKRFIRTKEPWMSEEDKDELDGDLMELIKSCSSRIDTLKLSEEARPVMNSVQEHQKEVVAYLLERLKCIADSAKQMQKKRYQQPFLLSSRLLPESDRKELDVLEQRIMRMRNEDNIKKHAKAASLNRADTPALLSPKSPALLTPSPRADSTPVLAVSPADQNKVIQHTASSKSQKPVLKTQQHEPVFPSKSDKLEFTEEEERSFRVENVMLHRHFQENLEDAKKIESKMTEISNLMGHFADKIMEQQTDIELIQHHAQETKSNVFQSNRILEQTQKVGKGYGLMIFCFYVGFSMVLHMLHYLNR